MNTKQIAEAVGKAEKTVRTWASKVTTAMETTIPALSKIAYKDTAEVMTAKMAAMTAKMAVSSSTNPADYNLEETCWIIEYGMGKNAADLFRMSAKQPTENLYPAPLQNAEVERINRLEAMVEKLCLAVATIPQAIQVMTRQPLQIDFVQEYYSLKAWARRSGFSLTYSEAVNYGRKAVKLSKLGGVEIRDIDDERYGKVHSYHTSVLKKVFEVNHG
jgi:hypothetical protein